MSTIVPVESSAAGAKPASRSAASTSEIGACDTATVGASSRISSCSAAGAATACASSAASSHRTNDAAMPTRSCPCRRATSSIRYVRPCGTGVFECRVEQRVQLAGGAPGVEGAPDRRLADAVHHRRARRFHRRDRRQLLGQVALQRSRHDDRQVGLQQEVVDGLRAAPCSIAAMTSSAGRRRAACASGAVIAPRPTTPSACASVSRSPTGSRLQPHRPAGAPPDHRARRLGGVDARARRQVGEHVQQQPPVQRSRGGEQRIRQRRIGFAVGAAAADQARPARQVQPRRRQQVPFGGRRGFDEPVGGHRRRPVRAGAVVRFGFRHPRRDQPRGRRHLEDQAEPAPRRCR